LSNEIIVVFGMLLAHHLSILFQRSKPKTISEINNDIQTDINNLKTNNKDENNKINNKDIKTNNKDENNITDL
jgi:hypothetical protein